MIYRFTMVSDEIDDFVREIQINPEATFYDLHSAILESVNFADDELTSFFICDEDWEREKEITLEPMDDISEEDSWTMKETKLNELIEDEKQKLTFVFDIMTERSFFIELSEIITRKDIKEAVCTRSEGNPPAQKVDFDEAVVKQTPVVNTDDLGEDFYGDKDYNEDDIDQEGFGVDGEDTSFEK
jgi:hypothetical protein